MKKRMLTLTLALALCLSLAVPAVAETVTIDTGDSWQSKMVITNVTSQGTLTGGSPIPFSIPQRPRPSPFLTG
jgi:hypothetical protein